MARGTPPKGKVAKLGKADAVARLSAEATPPAEPDHADPSQDMIDDVVAGRAEVGVDENGTTYIRW